MSGIDALMQWLVAQPTLIALTTRVLPVRVPQSSDLPAVTFHQVGGTALQHLHGVSLTNRVRLQITAWGLDYTTTKDIAGVLKTLLTGFSDLSGSDAGIVVQGIHLLNEIDGDVPPIDNNDVARYFTALDFHYWFVEGS